MSEPKTYSEKRFSENIDAMRRLASGERRVLIRAHWPDRAADMNQVLFYHDSEAEIEFYVSLYNRMVEALEAGFDNVPFFRVDFGRMAWLMSVAYGCEVIEVGKLLNSKPRFHSLEAIAELTPPEPVHEHGFYPEIARRMREIERRFGPVPFVPSDTQSPIDVATEVVATEPFLLGMYDSPELVHKLLEMLAVSIGDVLEHQASVVSNWIGYGHDYPLPVGVHLSDDNAAFLSPEVYEEFAAPTIETLADRFGGVTLHCCMGYQQNLNVMSSVRGFLGFDPQPGYNDRELILSAIRDRGFWRIFSVPEDSDPLTVYKEAIDQTHDRAGLMLDVHGADRDSALRLATQVREYADEKGNS
ncbi:MAG: uroporphyrinogen decarboxylase family protein [Spirochaetota bacterium]